MTSSTPASRDHKGISVQVCYFSRFIIPPFPFGQKLSGESLEQDEFFSFKERKWLSPAFLYGKGNVQRRLF